MLSIIEIQRELFISEKMGIEFEVTSSFANLNIVIETKSQSVEDLFKQVLYYPLILAFLYMILGSA